MPQAVFFGMAAEDMYASTCYRCREVNTAAIGSAIAAGGPHSESHHVARRSTQAVRSLSLSRSTTAVAPLNDGPQAFGLPKLPAQRGHC